MLSLFAQEEREKQRQSLNDPLELLERHVDFKSLAQVIDQKLARADRSKGGRPAYPTELMIRLLLLQQLYNLSDEALEYQVLDRRSFQRFLGLEYNGKVPDAKTVWVWRERLVRADLIQGISQSIGTQLQKAGFIARGGQIIDATIISAPIQRNTAQDTDQIKQGHTPSSWSKARQAQKDTDARWTKKHSQSYYGYKLHANVDRRWGFIRQHAVSPAHVHDSQMFEEILDAGNTARRILADSAYADQQRERALKAQGYRLDIQHKGTRAQALSEAQKRRNHRIAQDRVFVEHAFARMHQWGTKTLRTIGLARAKLVVGLKVGMHNLMQLADCASRHRCGTNRDKQAFYASEVWKNSA